MDYDIESELIPRDFPIIRDGVYMKNGTFDPTPFSTIKAITNF